MWTNRPCRDIWYMSFVNLREGRIVDFMAERIRQEGRVGELWTAPTKERKLPSK